MLLLGFGWLEGYLKKFSTCELDNHRWFGGFAGASHGSSCLSWPPTSSFTPSGQVKMYSSGNQGEAIKFLAFEERVGRSARI